MKQKTKLYLAATLMMASINSLAALTDHFVTTWETTVGNTTITIPTTGTGYNYSIDWDGDNSVDETGITGNATHDYGVAGIHTVRITGDFPRIFLNNTGDKEKIVSIDQWGTNTWATMRKAFSGASNLVNNATDEPIMATSSSFLQMFLNATSIGTGAGNWDWDTSNVTNMQGMFNNTQFDEDISSWNVENVTSIIGMLSNTTLSTVNYDALLISWDAQSLSANETFDAGNAVYCSTSAQTAHASIIANDGWTINDGGLCNQAPTITTDATIFSPENQVDVVIVTSTDLENDIITYNISASGADSALFSIDSNSGQLTFDNAPDFEMPNSAAGTNTYEVSVQAIDDGTPVNFSVKTINVTVTDVIEFQPEDLFITTWKTDNTVASNVTSITIPTDSSFTYDYHVDWDNDGILDELNITGDITHDFGAIDEYTIAIYGKFPTIKFVNGANKYKIIEINQWGTNPWETFAQSFFTTHNLLNKASDTPNLSNCIDLSYMFAAAFKIGSAQDSGNWDWDVSNVTHMNSMFSGAIVFNKDISMWQTSNVVNMYKMFQGAQDFDQNLSSWDVEAVVSFNDMFIDVTLSSTNYDALLISWDNQTVSQGEGFDGGNSQYCSQAAADARQSLIDNDGWIIIDGGLCNQAPTITTDATIFSPENQVDVVIVTSTDPNGDTVTYSITGGADMSKFTINSTTGQLDFNSEPDFENPTDSGTDNTYVVEITATDNGTPNLSTTKTITVNVTDVVEGIDPTLFITSWKTDNPGTSNDTSITIPTSGFETYAYQVDWNGDGDFDDADEATIQTGQATHDYDVAGTYSIGIKGDFPRIYFFGAGDKEKIISIDQWGTIAWDNLKNAFEGAENLVNHAQDTPNLSNTNSLSRMFANCDSIGSNDDTGNWDWNILTITSLSAVFFKASSFNKDISSWMTTNVISMYSMFSGADSFNQDISIWNTGNVTSMSAMFNDAGSFNQDISTWDTGNVTSMSTMFYRAIAFDQNLADWDIENVTDFSLFLRNIALSTPNYEALLISWSAQSVSPSIFSFDGGNSQFCSALAISARQNLENTFNWNMRDGGIVHACGDEISLSISITDNSSSYLPGQLIDYLVVVENSGANDVINSELSVFLGSSSLVSSNVWTCNATGGASCTPSSGTGYIDDFVDIPVGGILTYTVTVQIINSIPNNDFPDFSIEAFVYSSDYQYENNLDDNYMEDINTNADLLFANGFEVSPKTVVTNKSQAQFDFSKVNLQQLPMLPMTIVAGQDDKNKINLFIHLRNLQGQLQIRMSNKQDGIWQVGQWTDVYNQGLTTLEW